MSHPSRFESAIARIDEENARDPNIDLHDGKPVPRELWHARRMTEWILRLCPAAPEPLLLAARAQHLGRWEIPRETYPMNRAGYLKWREDLKHHHARNAATLLSDLGYPPEQIARVQYLIRKQGFPADQDARALEDALCLVFIQFQLAEFVRRTAQEKLSLIIRKTWNKMSEQAREHALGLTLEPEALEAVVKALNTT